ncbi:hypothetical protein [Halorhodospira halochloris]|uniref:hypothetical protein n=1 Tax=Halorhodospira halochloris TaxID=1052 RepID=UPI001EE8EE4C|nr:hypothetical protein [Halorhodospira halochloris]MCG5547972.1 hypothetical protein [Halorhodospira halochloris]
MTLDARHAWLTTDAVHIKGAGDRASGAVSIGYCPQELSAASCRIVMNPAGSRR